MFVLFCFVLCFLWYLLLLIMLVVSSVMLLLEFVELVIVLIYFGCSFGMIGFLNMKWSGIEGCS